MMDSTGKQKRILFINPGKADGFCVDETHLGLSLMASLLAEAGHAVKIIDYSFLNSVKDKIRIPSPEEVMDEFAPDAVGISVFTYHYKETQQMIQKVSDHANLPIILGGPHLNLFPEDFISDKRISYLVRGDGETVIVKLIEAAQRESTPVVIEAALARPEEIPPANLGAVYGFEHLTVYQIQQSRGCPYQCGFCNVKIFASRKVRARDLDVCIKEILEVKKKYPNIRHITITDDCPAFDIERFKLFLKKFKNADTGFELSMSNMRADGVDEEVVWLYKAAGGTNICLGVESGHPYVFSLTNKGETLEEIIKAAGLIRRAGLTLGICFVIGLPEDNLKRHRYSIRLAQQLHPQYIFWNMYIPWPGTEGHQWYKAHGKIDNCRNFSTHMDPNGNFNEPICSTPDFSKNDRIRAWLMANLETRSFFTCVYQGTLWKLAKLAFRYQVPASFVVFLFTQYPRMFFVKYCPVAIRSFLKRKRSIVH